jgi:hypothetical protein
MRTIPWTLMTALVVFACDNKRDVDADWSTDSGYSGGTVLAGTNDGGAGDADADGADVDADGAAADDGAADDGAADDGAADDGAADDGAADDGAADDGAADDGAADDGAADDGAAGEITQIDEWEVPEDPPTDILFYLDQSCSMEDDQARLAAQTTTFIDSIESYSDDWQIIVSNADNGCNQTGGVLSPGVSDYVDRFQAAVSAGGGFWTEAGLTITSQAVEQTDPDECNEGFLRADSMLHIIMISDEPEQSTSSWSWYVDKVIAKKGSASLVRFSAIAGDWPAGCATAEPGEGYHQAVSATSGVYLSICSDWATPENMTRLALASALPSSYALSHSPIVDSLQVWINSTARTDAWSHDADSNSIVFVGPIPSMGDHIRVEYTLESTD